MPSRSRSRSPSVSRRSPPRREGSGNKSPYTARRSPASRSPAPRARSWSRSRSRTRSPRRSRTPDSRSSSRGRGSLSPARSDRDRRNGQRGSRYSRSRSRTPSNGPSSRSRSPVRRFRSRSFTRSPTPPPRRSAKIIVEKLTKNVNENHLREIFGAYGEIQSLELPMNRQFMTNRGTAYIHYNQPADAEAAIAHMHEAQLDGAVLSVSIILPRRTFAHSPPSSSRQGRPDPRRFGPSYGRGSSIGDSSRAPPPPSRFRSPPRGGRPFRPRGDRHDIYRPRSASRSRSPVRRSRSASPYSRSRSATPPRRRSRRDSPPRRRRRSSSSSSRSRSPSRSRSRSRGRYSGR